MIDRRYESGKSFVMYSKEELEAARRTDMVTFLESHEGFSFKSSGGWYIGIEHDSLKINPDRYTWHWYSRDLYGKGAIDWLCKVDGYDVKEAVSRLIGNTSIRASPEMRKAVISEQHYQKKTKKAEFKAPPPMQGKWRELFAYLNITRKLPADIINYCVSNKLIYLDVKKRAIFCGYDKFGSMKFAEAKITNTYNKYYPQNIEGSMKEYSFYIPAKPNAYGYDPTKLYVFEAPIDLLSHGALMQLSMIKQCAAVGMSEMYRSDCWLGINRVSLSGCSDIALKQRLSDDPRIKQIVFCLENDERGRQATEGLERYAEIYCNVKKQKNKYGGIIMRKIIEKIKEKGVKLSARIFGALTACLSTIVAAYADAEEAGTGGVWSSAAAWITKNKEGLSVVAQALLGLCIVGVVICLGFAGKNGISSVKNWLIAIGVAAALLVFGDAFLQSIYVA